jgi:hypothetical protein
MRVAIGTAALLAGLALYALLAMHVAVTVLPDSLVVQTLYYLVAGLLWVWPAARLTRWIQRG